MQQPWGLNALNKDGFTRQLHQLAVTLLSLFATFGQAIKALHTSSRYAIDSVVVR